MRKEKKDNKVTVVLDISLDILHQLYGLAIFRKTTVDEVIEDILKDYIKNHTL